MGLAESGPVLSAQPGELGRGTVSSSFTPRQVPSPEDSLVGLWASEELDLADSEALCL